MRKLTTSHRFALAAAILMIVVLMSAGCSRSPLQSVESSQPQVLQRISSTEGGPQLAVVNLYTEEMISSERGGTITLLDVVLEIPAGAVLNDTLFSIFIPDDELFYNEFGTDGLKFDKPVTVTMSYRGADLGNVNESTIRIGYHNQDTDEWVDMVCEVDHVNKTVTAELYHFSAYALVSD